MEKESHSSGASGRLINVTDIFSKQARYKNGLSNYYADPNTNVITFRKADRTEHKIEIKKEKGQYHYDGYASDNLYAVMVHTRLFDELFGTYPQQHVALTHECLALPLEDQPWFFGAISESEAEHLLDHAATNRTFLTRYDGHEAWLHWSGGTKKGNRTLLKHYKLMPDQIALMLTGLNNNGEVKLKEEFSLHRLVVEGELNKVKQFISDKQYSVEHLTELSFLREHLEKAKTINDELVHWLIDFGVPASSYVLTREVFQRSAETALWLIDRGSQCAFTVIEHVIAKGVSYRLFLKLWDALTPEAHDYPRLLLVLQKHATEYKGETSEQSTLVVAWQFGNDDNYFQMLPREIIRHLFSFGIAESDWFHIGATILSRCEKQDTSPYYSCPVLSKVLPFVFKFWDQFSELGLRNLLYWLYVQVGFDSLPKDEAQIVVKWCIKLWQEKIPLIPKIDNYGNGPFLLGYCARHEEAFELFKLLVDYDPEAVRLSCWDFTTNTLMPVWSFTVPCKNKRAARYLVSRDLCKNELEWFVK